MGQLLPRLFDLGLGILKPDQIPVVGARLRAIGNQIWVADRELQMPGGIRLPCRMVVMGDGHGNLLCYSPVALDEETVEALDGLGRVRWIVAPNRYHRSFTAGTVSRYPQAEVSGYWSPPGRGFAPPPAAPFDGCELMTVTLRSGFSEIVAYHDLSETLVVCDLLFNVRSGDRRLRALMRLNGAWQTAGHTRLQRWLLLRDQEGLAMFRRWALSRPFVQIAMAHGQVIQHDARECLYALQRREPAGSISVPKRHHLYR